MTLPRVTLRNRLEPLATGWDGVREIAGVRYYTSAEVVEATGVSRQTLYRWRRSGFVPAGHVFRSNRLLFSQSELDRILAYANHLEPGALGVKPGQLDLPIAAGKGTR